MGGGKTDPSIRTGHSTDTMYLVVPTINEDGNEIEKEWDEKDIKVKEDGD